VHQAELRLRRRPRTRLAASALIEERKRCPRRRATRRLRFRGNVFRCCVSIKALRALRQFGRWRRGASGQRCARTRTRDATSAPASSVKNGSSLPWASKISARSTDTFASQRPTAGSCPERLSRPWLGPQVQAPSHRRASRRALVLRSGLGPLAPRQRCPPRGQYRRGSGPSPRLQRPGVCTGAPPGLLPAPARRLNARSFDRPATGRSCGALARVCGRGVLSPRRPRRALHHGPVAAFERGEDAAPDRADPPPHARSRPQDEPCGTSALDRVPQRPPLPLTGSGCQTRSRPDPGRARRPLRARLGRWSPPGKGIAPDLDPRGR
jgi:hypothetical protein